MATKLLLKYVIAFLGRINQQSPMWTASAFVNLYIIAS